MKIAFCSDLHLEINHDLPNRICKIKPVDVLLLAGDITCMRYFTPGRTDAESRSMQKRFKNFLDDKCADVGKILWIPGNHEYYRHYFTNSEGPFSSIMRDIDPRIHFSDQLTYVDVDNKITIIGATLWTDFNRSDPHAELVVQDGMNDFRVIGYKRDEDLTYEDRHANSHGNRNRLRATHVRDVHHRHFSFIKALYEDANEGGHKTVVFTHHAPTFRSHSVARFGDTMIKYGYCSDYEGWLSESNIHTWIHGHTHHNVDYDCGGTRIASAMHGYVGYDRIPYKKGEQFKVGYLDVCH